MIDIDKIEAAAKAATPGPWWIDNEGDVDLPNHVGISAERHGLLAQVVWKMADDERTERCEATATHIATANPQAVLEMISMIRERDAALKPGVHETLEHVPLSPATETDMRIYKDIAAGYHKSRIKNDLFNACKDLIAYCDKHPPMGDSLWSVQRIRAAINEVEGAAPPAQTPPPRLTVGQVTDIGAQSKSIEGSNMLPYTLARAVETAVRRQFGVQE